MNEKNIYLSVIIPAYNEGGRKGLELERNVKEIGEYMRNKNWEYELIIVSDGSKDNTVEFSKNLAGLVDGRLEVVDREENKGKWYSVREGFMKARGEYNLLTDADGSTPISNLDGFLEAMNRGENIIIGSRDLKGSKIKKHQPKWKEVLGDVGNIFIQFMLGLRGIYDTQCGFKVVSKEVVERIVSRMEVDRWGGDFEMLALARKMGYKIIEIPVVWVDAGQTLVHFSAYVNTLKELFQVKLRLVSGKYKLSNKK